VEDWVIWQETASAHYGVSIVRGLDMVLMIAEGLGCVATVLGMTIFHINAQFQNIANTVLERDISLVTAYLDSSRSYLSSVLNVVECTIMLRTTILSIHFGGSAAMLERESPGLPGQCTHQLQLQ